MRSKLIYKILRPAEWEAFQALGQFGGAPVDLADGYIHFSTAKQAMETANKHFADEERVQLVEFEAESFGADLKWEPSRRDDLFPHLYGQSLKAEQIKRIWSMSKEQGGFVLPEEIG